MVATEHSSEKMVALEGVPLSKNEPSTSQDSQASCKVLEAWHHHDAICQVLGKACKRALPRSTRAEDWSLSMTNAGLQSGGVVARARARKHWAVGSSGSSASGCTL